MINCLALSIFSPCCGIILFAKNSCALQRMLCFEEVNRLSVFLFFFNKQFSPIIYNIFFQDIDYYNVTSVFLGVGVICVWVGLLRFVTYFKEYNVCVMMINFVYLFIHYETFLQGSISDKSAIFNSKEHG